MSGGEGNCPSSISIDCCIALDLTILLPGCLFGLAGTLGSSPSSMSSSNGFVIMVFERCNVGLYFTFSSAGSIDGVYRLISALRRGMLRRVIRSSRSGLIKAYGCGWDSCRMWG
jgi:hypothetical protein